jgi:tetratricopeptide (TPR) repeat protein
MAYYLKDIDLQIHGCTLIGVLYKSMYQYTEAIQYHERCLEIARKEGDKRIERFANYNLGLNYLALSNYHEAIDCHKKSLNIALENQIVNFVSSFLQWRAIHM